ncbi:hypothetical protein NP233_g12597 [Leucocoprinus birnbaumii]|uniref:Uncharacterized protein n=1 Tax=Leucocoprinus birnbaumii TaxID=56174 RepID=A0AAD5YMX7_9AGAR|nr:hypothetical protein NP233_g12597 [Leucocoprinus birnbaumii]
MFDRMFDFRIWDLTRKALDLVQEDDIVIFIWHPFYGPWASASAGKGDVHHSIADHILNNGHIDQPKIILMTTDWGSPGVSLAKKEETEIELGRQFHEYPVLFERLESESIEHCWDFIRRVIGRLDGHLDKGDLADQDIIAQVKRDAENWRVKWIQQDIDELYAELAKAQDGNDMCKRLERALEDESKYLEPILAQMDNESLAEEEKQRLEEKMEEEYALSRREFQRYFQDVQEMKITIGPYLREFYMLPGLKIVPKKKRFGIF